MRSGSLRLRLSSSASSSNALARSFASSMIAKNRSVHAAASRSSSVFLVRCFLPVKGAAKDGERLSGTTIRTRTQEDVIRPFLSRLVTRCV